MEYKIIEKEEDFLKTMGDQYIIEDESVKETPSSEEYIAAVKLFNNEFKKFPVKSQFRDEPAIVLLDEEDDEPTYILGAELSSEKAVDIKTIEYISTIMQNLSSKFRFFVVFEYNYIGFDFTCFFEKDSVYFCFKDDISQKLFGIK